MTVRGPAATDAATSKRLARQRRRDTAPELVLRRILHARGLRYFVDRAPEHGMRRRADLVFPRAKVCVFVDGCFWHRCPQHGTSPRRNREWWESKLGRNVERDHETDRRLEDAGWRVVRVWEHEPPEAAADRVEEAVSGGTRSPVAG